MRFKYLLFTIGFAAQAHISNAATKEVEMEVNAYVGGTCEIKVEPLNFGAVDPNIRVAEVTAETQLAINCTGGLEYGVEFGAGSNQNVGSDRNMRKLVKANNANGGQNYLYYNLYFDPRYNHPLGGETSAISNETIKGVGSGRFNTHDIYGKIFYHDDTKSAEMGLYQDKVVISVIY